MINDKDKFTGMENAFEQFKEKRISLKYSDQVLLIRVCKEAKMTYVYYIVFQLITAVIVLYSLFTSEGFYFFIYIQLAILICIITPAYFIISISASTNRRIKFSVEEVDIRVKNKWAKYLRKLKTRDIDLTDHRLSMNSIAGIKSEDKSDRWRGNLQRISLRLNDGRIITLFDLKSKAAALYLMSVITQVYGVRGT